jgi:hypothetical protein
MTIAEGISGLAGFTATSKIFFDRMVARIGRSFIGPSDETAPSGDPSHSHAWPAPHVHVPRAVAVADDRMHQQIRERRLEGGGFDNWRSAAAEDRHVQRFTVAPIRRRGEPLIRDRTVPSAHRRLGSRGTHLAVTASPGRRASVG